MRGDSMFNKTKKYQKKKQNLYFLDILIYYTKSFYHIMHAMYFAIIGKHPTISIQELAYIQPKNTIIHSHHTITFDTDYPDSLETL